MTPAKRDTSNTAADSRKQPAAKSKTPTARKPKPAGDAASGGAKKDRDICFVISPFGGWYDKYFDDVYAPAIDAADLDPRRVDDWYRPSAIVQDIWGLVSSCRVMLADLTGKNTNVFYELGLAHAVGKPVVLLTQDLADVPFDLQSLRVLVYKLEDPTWAEDLRSGITQALREVLDDPAEAILTPFVKQTVEKKPHISSEDRRLLRLQREVTALSSQMDEVLRGSPRTRSRRRDIGPAAAEAVIREFLDEGMPTRLIVERVAELGPPPDWILERVGEMRARRK